MNKIRISFFFFLLNVLLSCQFSSDNSSSDGMPPGPPPGAPPMPPGGFPDGMPPPPPFNLDPHKQAAIYIKKGKQITGSEYSEGKVDIKIAKGANGISGTGVDGLLITSSDYDATGIVVADGTFKLGGNKDYYTIIPNLENDYVGTQIAPEFDPASEYNFNSVLIFSLETDEPEEAITGSSGIDAANDGKEFFIENAYLQVDGAQRYVSSTYGDATMVINDSYLVSTGNANGHTNDIPLPFSNEALLISGAARTNFTISTSNTYFNNSIIVAEGWAALSTDAASGDGLDLYAYNSKAFALNGGYGTYADFTCRVWLYGSLIEAAEVGGILSKSGQINVLDGGAATDDVLNYNTGAKTTKGSYLKAGRNALMIHAPDMMGEGLKAVDHGTVNVIKSTLETSNDLESKFDYKTYGDGITAYINYIKGDLILIKSTSATVNLAETTLKPSNGVLFHTVLNSDRMGNFLKPNDNKAKDKKGNIIVQPISLNLSNMSCKGDILHDDYHRNMMLKLFDTKLEGSINQGTHISWKKLWADKGIVEAQWLKDDNWTGTNELMVSLDSKSSWIVTETSVISKLSLDEGASILAPYGFEVILNVDGKDEVIEPGTYQGKIMLSIRKLN